MRPKRREHGNGRVLRAGLATVLAVPLALALPVQASSWLECEVQARLLELQAAPDPRPARIRVVGSVITDGMGGIGTDCFEPDRELEIALTLPTGIAAGEIPAPGATIYLEYSHYSAMGSQGAVSRTTWRLLPSP